MSFEDRVRSSVDQALGTLVEQVKQHAAEERDAAVAAAREQAFADAEQATVARVEDAEARVRATIEDIVAQRLADDRAVAAREIRREIEADLDAKSAEKVTAIETRMNLLLADARSQAEQALKDSVAAARVREREVELAGVTRLLEAVRGLDGASSLSEVLDALALAAAREAARAAVVVLRGDRIQGWKLAGFGPRDANPKSVDLSLAEAGVIGMAVGAARAVTTRDGQAAAAGPGFQVLPVDRMGLAVPVIVGGRVVAVVYGDSVTLDGQDRGTPSGWPEVIEVLARHAGRCLEALTTQKQGAKTATGAKVASGASGASGAAGAEGPARSTTNPPDTSAAKRVARLLVSEIRLYHEPAVDEGRRQGNLLQRLAPEIEKARRLYEAQVPAMLRGETDFFQQELIRTLAGGDASLLGNTA
ncbi:MAG: hypothetical protein ABI665_04230 [Vicinamibacterales bacterium]